MGFFETYLGTEPAVFVGLTVAFFGGAAFLTGQALANGWNQAWKAVPYAMLLSLGDRFLVYNMFDGRFFTWFTYTVFEDDLHAIAEVALFGGDVLTLLLMLVCMGIGLFLHSLVLLAICLIGFRLTKVRKMVSQYPWLYERVGLFGWREKGG
jgi:branched-chain amino acid transport system ATP-binding protein